MTARQHHYIPQCYLKGFVRHRDKPKVFTIDLKKRSVFRASTANVAVERDFHRVDIEGMAPDAFEQAFSGFEGKVAQALGDVIAARSLDNSNDRALIINLICIISVKNPRLRETMRDYRERIAVSIMGLNLETPERWALTVKKMLRAGYANEGSSPNYEDMKRFMEERKFKVTVDPMEHLRTELKLFHETLPLMFGRKWKLFKAPRGCTGFVTSDHPVCLMWTDPKRQNTFLGPGYALRHTNLFFPISNELAMVGAVEGEEGEFEASPLVVAAFNGAFVIYAERQIYARDSDFLYTFLPGEKPRRGDTLLQDRRLKRPPSQR